MAKNLKLNIKNAQIAQAINLDGIKSKLSKKKAGDEIAEKEVAEKESSKATSKEDKLRVEKKLAEERKEEPVTPRKARSRSAFAESQYADSHLENEEEIEIIEPVSSEETAEQLISVTAAEESPEEHLPITEDSMEKIPEAEVKQEEALQSTKEAKVTEPAQETVRSVEQEISSPPLRPRLELRQPTPPPRFLPPKEKLGPTGRHIKDLLPPPRPKPQPKEELRKAPPYSGQRPQPAQTADEDRLKKAKVPDSKGASPSEESEEAKAKKGAKGAKFREFKDLKPAKKSESSRFDARDRQGLRASEDEQEWRKKRSNKYYRPVKEETIRPSALKIRLPIILKDLASEMKLKASELVGKLFLQGTIVTLNDILEDETIVQLLGHEFGCEITIDRSEQERIRITDKTIREEVECSDPSQLITRPPIVAFMGHVDHGKTSLIDAIRKSNRVAGEAGAITQHIGAFRCHTPVGDITVLDTPGHEAFSAMRARGADVTDIVVLVVAGDEGIRQQTVEAIQHAKAAKVTIVVAINKSDKPNFNPEVVYRQLSEHELLPEAWGGQTITINCSAVSGDGIKELLEMLALQAEILELRANPHVRARGNVIESELHKGLGAAATVLVQNGTLKLGDSVVFEHYFGRIKTMRDEHGRPMTEAGPATPVEITGLSGLPEAGQEFISVKNEKEAREISEARLIGHRQTNLQSKKKLTIDNMMQASESGKKILNVVLRADVQGSLEALKVALQKINSDKADLNIIFTGVGEISESDVQLAAASKAVIIGFHTQLESHADSLVKELGVQVRIHDIIYHAIDDAKALMAGLLDKIPQETEKGKALVKATFKSSQVGVIAGCQVIEGSIHRNNLMRLRREGAVVWTGSISSLKRVKEDVREVQKGVECGILLSGFHELKEDDILEAYEITYLTQEL
ncbi:Translation initiation factor IF-2 [Chlamydiales bacterium STE3]|nr:Translation initiation factor IF-2 [Chlamydiales bacterium STE3]